MKILISDDLGASGIEKLMSVPEFQVDARKKVAPEELCQIIKDYDALVIRSATKVTAERHRCCEIT